MELENMNVVTCPPCGESTLKGGKGVVKGNSLLDNPPSALRATSPAGGEVNGGFTLIELLVVILIIGILAAVAVPQYQKAVEKSRASEAISLLKSVYQAAQAYYLANGKWPDTVRDLDIDIPWTGSVDWRTPGHYHYGVSNKDWSIQFISQEGAKGISIGRIAGKYTGTGFHIYLKPSYAYIPIGEILCVEKGADAYVVTPISTVNGHYCAPILNGKRLETAHSAYFYKLP